MSLSNLHFTRLLTRHIPEGIWFKQRAYEVGFKQAVAELDSGDPIPSSKNWSDFARYRI